MNITKITSMVLKELRANRRVIYFGTEDGYVWVSPDRAVAYRLHVSEVEFNLEKCEQNNKIIVAVQDKGRFWGEPTGNMRRESRFGKELLLEISYGQPEESTWINEKYIKPLGDPSFRVSGKESVVWAYEYSSQEPCAAIMSFRIDKDLQ